jgi:RNA polymerase sigma-70 factor (ECF subfamily)
MVRQDLISRVKKGDRAAGRQLSTLLQKQLRSSSDNTPSIIKMTIVVVLENILIYSGDKTIIVWANYIAKHIRNISSKPSLYQRKAIAKRALESIGSDSAESSRYPSYEEEREMVLRMQAGDREGAQQLYTWFYADLLHQVRSMEPDDANAKDFVQDSFIIALEKIDSFIIREPPVSIFFWLLRIAKNLVLGNHRRNSTHEEKRDQIAQLTLNQTSAEFKDPQYKIARNEQLAILLEKALPELKDKKPKYAEIIRLRFLEDRSREECANIMNMKPNTFSVNCRRALALLHDLYQKSLV